MCHQKFPRPLGEVGPPCCYGVVGFKGSLERAKLCIGEANEQSGASRMLNRRSSRPCHDCIYSPYPVVVQRLSDDSEIRGGVGPGSVEGSFQKSLGHGDGFGLADGGLGHGDDVSARVDAVELRGLAKAVEDLGNVNTSFGPGAAVILPS